MVATLVVAVVMAVLAATASAATYYVSSTGCRDTYAGTSSTDTGTNGPWCSLSKASEAALRAGDSVLLNRGSSWSGQYLSFTASGTAEAHLTLGAYGTGARPVVAGTERDTERMIRFRDVEYWDIRDLEVSRAGAGIVIYFSTLGHKGFTFENLYVHDFRGIWVGFTTTVIPREIERGPFDPNAQADGIIMSSGIIFTGDNTLTPEEATQYLAREITMSNIEGTHNVDSITFDAFRWPADTVNLGAAWFKDILLRNLYLHDDDGDNVFEYTRYRLGCSDALRFIGVTNATVVDSLLTDEAACRTLSGTAAAIVGRTREITFVNSMLVNTPNTSSLDETAFDLEYAHENTTVSHSYIAGNVGPGIEVLNTCAGCTIQHSRNSQFVGNLFQSNSATGGAIRMNLTLQTNMSATATSNLFFEGIETLMNGQITEQRNSNNTRLREAGYYGAAGFSSTQGTNQWRYQYKPAGGSYRDLPSYDATNRWWYQSAEAPQNQRVRAFDLSPGTCARCDVSRTWVSPVPAYVNIRGQLLKSEVGGDGVVARIERVEARGGVTQVWPVEGGDYRLGASDRTGTATDIDHVFVAAGDLLRFEVGSGERGENTNDEVSWTPAIGIQELLTAEWNFATAGNTENWTAGELTQTVAEGVDHLGTFASVESYIQSPNLLAKEAATWNLIKIRIRNNTSSDFPRIMFITNEDTTWNEAKSLTKVVTTSDGEYKEYVFDFSGLATWRGTIKQMRFYPARGGFGSVDVDFIRWYAAAPVLSSRTADFGFATEEERWVSEVGMAQSVSSGIDTLTTTLAEANILSSNRLLTETDTYRYLKIRMKNNTTSTTAKIGFRASLAPRIEEAKTITFPIHANDTEFHEYVVDMSRNAFWYSTLVQLKFQPTPATTGTIEVDYIRMSNTP